MIEKLIPSNSIKNTFISMKIQFGGFSPCFMNNNFIERKPRIQIVFKRANHSIGFYNLKNRSDLPDLIRKN
jgi:hypothetical protein